MCAGWPVPGVTRAHSVRGSSRHQGPWRGGSARGAGLEPRAPDAPAGQRPRPQARRGCGPRQPRGVACWLFLLPGPAHRVRAECDLQTEPGRAGERGRGPGSEGAGRLGTLPPPSPPPSWWRVSSGNRGFRKTELLRPPGRREQTASASVTPPPPAPPAVCPHQASRHLDGPGPPRGNRVREGGKGATRSFSTARAGLAPGGEVYVLRLFKGKESSGHLRRRSGAPRWLWAASGTLAVATSLLPACSPHKHLSQVPPQLPEG